MMHVTKTFRTYTYIYIHTVGPFDVQYECLGDFENGMYVYMHVCMYVCMYACISDLETLRMVCIYSCVYVCMYVCVTDLQTLRIAFMYACMYIYTYIYACVTVLETLTYDVYICMHVRMYV